MGRKGKPKKKDKSNLGRALQRRQAPGGFTLPAAPATNAGAGSSIGGTAAGSAARSSQPHMAAAAAGQAGLQSVLEVTSLEDFVASATMSGRDFLTERSGGTASSTGESAITASGTGVGVSGLPVYATTTTTTTAQADARERARRSGKVGGLAVPRRPPWTAQMTAQELDRQEREAFLQWRRDIARLEEEGRDAGLSVTPFEKNVQVWRQLWRVLERSDFVLQIVDARNPLFYYSSDLVTYASELDPPRPMFVLVNKADFLTADQRRRWAEYFTEQGWKFLFFSARREQEALNAEDAAQRRLESVSPPVPPPQSQSEMEPTPRTETEMETEMATGLETVPEREGDAEPESKTDVSGGHRDVLKVLTRDELVSFVRTYAAEQGLAGLPVNNGRICVGMVGYPNVGKSSVINVLVGVTRTSHGRSRVSVSSTPGKTKHFQTLHIPDTTDLMLCDCPGLVFPSIVNSTADMVCAGVYPIHQMRDYVSPVQLLATRIPLSLIQATYGHTNMPALSGEADTSQSSRTLLKDYVDGKLLFCHPPPTLTAEEADAFREQTLPQDARILERWLLVQAAEREEEERQRAALAAAEAEAEAAAQAEAAAAAAGTATGTVVETEEASAGGT